MKSAAAPIQDLTSPAAGIGHSGNGAAAHAFDGRAPGENGHAAPLDPAAAVSPAAIPFLDKCRAYDIPDKIKAAGLWTYFRAIESAQDPEVYINGQRLVMLGSNNYLGL